MGINFKFKVKKTIGFHMDNKYNLVSKELSVITEGESKIGIGGGTPTNWHEIGANAWEKAKHGNAAKGAALGAGIGALAGVVGNALKDSRDPTKKGYLRAALGGASAGSLIGGVGGWAAKKVADSDYFTDVQKGMVHRALMHNAIYGGPKRNYIKYSDGHGNTYSRFYDAGDPNFSSAEIDNLRNGGYTINRHYTIDRDNRGNLSTRNFN